MQQLRSVLNAYEDEFAAFSEQWDTCTATSLRTAGISPATRLRPYQLEGVDWLARKLAFRAHLRALLGVPAGEVASSSLRSGDGSMDLGQDDGSSYSNRVAGNSRTSNAALTMAKALCNHTGAILGDEMGLGKTLQSIGVIQLARSRLLDTTFAATSAAKPCLVVAPLSVLDNWAAELEKFAPSLAVVSYAGSKEERQSLGETLVRQTAAMARGSMHRNGPVDVILTTFDIAIKDAEVLQSISFSAMVVDEAHRLKNAESVLFQTLSQFSCPFRLLLTGTPVQNNLSELYSLFRFVAPKVFTESLREGFLETFDEVASDEESATELHLMLKPFLLRREKAQVAADLPAKEEVVLQCTLTQLQKKYYKAILKKDIDAFANPTKTRLMNILMELRKCVNHPYLFDGVEPEPFQLGRHLIDASTKLRMLDALLPFLKQRGHRVLIFSQMTRMLDILQDYLHFCGYGYERLDGSVRGEERFLAVNKFNGAQRRPTNKQAAAKPTPAFKAPRRNVIDSDDDDDEPVITSSNSHNKENDRSTTSNNIDDDDNDCFVFLLSTRAGGLGLNLVSADTVIFFDSDFNPQADLQAAARAHRLGQTRPVRVIRLVAQHTVEEIVLRRAQRKLELTHAVIQKGHFGGGTQSAAQPGEVSGATGDELSDMLKYGVEHLFVTESVDDDELTDAYLTSLVGDTDPKTQHWLPMAAPIARESVSDDDAAAESTGPSRQQQQQQQQHQHQQQQQPQSAKDEEISDSLYLWEGRDYSEQAAAKPSRAKSPPHPHGFDALLAEAEGERSATESRSGMTMDGRQRRARRPRSDDEGDSQDEHASKLSPAELLERRRQREEAELERQQERLAQKAKRQARERAKKLELWKSHGYHSQNLVEMLDAVASGTEQELEEEEDKAEDQHHYEYLSASLPVLVRALLDKPQAAGPQRAVLRRCSSSSSVVDEDDEDEINFVSGDVTRPQVQPGESCVVVHVVDDEGRWGRGGVFSALDRHALARGTRELKTVGDCYERAAEMDDLHLGDVHLVELASSDSTARRWVALLVCFKRDRNGNLAPLAQAAFITALEKIATFALGVQASVHLPRIGHNMRGTDYYSIERIIRSRLARAGVHTSIYYYSKHGGSAAPAHGQPSSSSSSSSGVKASSASSGGGEEEQGRKVPGGQPPKKSTLSDSRRVNDMDTEDELEEAAAPARQAAPVRQSAPVFAKEHSMTSEPMMQQQHDDDADPALPDTFVGTNILLSPQLSPDVKRRLQRYIVAYGGTIVKPAELDLCTHVVVPSLDSAASDRDNGNAPAVLPSWIDACIAAGSLVPIR